MGYNLLMDKPLQLSSYSTFNPAVFGKARGERVSAQILKVLIDFLATKDLKRFKVLDVGCSSGIVSTYLSDYFDQVIAIDIDKKAIKLAKQKNNRLNLKFRLTDIKDTRYSKNYFDIVICNQTVYCAEKPAELMDKVFYYLKPGGICFFANLNKYNLYDFQYKLPLLSILPKKQADWYVRRFKRAKVFICAPLSFNQLKKLCSKFIIHKFTAKILHNPRKYSFKNLERFEKILRLIPVSIWEKLEPLIPNFIWILEKPLN